MAKANILIVEDTRIIALSIKNDLESLGYHVVSIIDNGLGAIKTASESDIDLILMDINIKGDLDGIETSEQILKTKDVPIIYLTAYTDGPTVERARKTSPYGYIIKPYEEKTLEITIDFALYKHKHEKLFRKIFNATQDGIAITDIDGNILDKNISSFKMLNTEDDNFKETLNRFGESNEIDEYFKTLFQNKKATLEIQNNNTKTFLEIKGVTADFNGIESFLHIICDITAKKDTERQIVSAVIETEERERQSFAEELHDGIGPLLSTLKTYLNTLSDEKNLDLQKEIIDKLFTVNDEILSNIKEISNNLKPHLLKNFGFKSAINTYLKKLEEAYPAKSFDCNIKIEDRFAENIEISLFRITSELLNNSIKHAEATKISVDLNKNDDLYTLVYTDNGKGFEIATSKEYEGMGLENILNRVKAIPGKIEISSSKGAGFTCTILIHEDIFNLKQTNS